MERRRRRGEEAEGETRRRGEEEEEEGGMAAFANLGGGGCQCNLTHHHQLIYEPILHHLNRPFKRFQGVLGAPAGNRACPAPLRARSPQRPCHHHATMHATPISPRALAFAFMGMWHLVGCK